MSPFSCKHWIMRNYLASNIRQAFKKMDVRQYIKLCSYDITTINDDVTDISEKCQPPFNPCPFPKKLKGLQLSLIFQYP